MAIRRENDASTLEIERIERVEKFRLGCALARDQVDIVDAEQVEPAMGATELLDRSAANRCDERLRERLAGCDTDASAGMSLTESLRNSVDEVCLSDAAGAVEKERSMATLVRIDELGCGAVRNSVALRDQKRVKSVLLAPIVHSGGRVNNRGAVTGTLTALGRDLISGTLAPVSVCGLGSERGLIDTEANTRGVFRAKCLSGRFAERTSEASIEETRSKLGRNRDFDAIAVGHDPGLLCKVSTDLPLPMLTPEGSEYALNGTRLPAAFSHALVW